MNVTIFSTTTCKYCKTVKDHLAQNNISYDEVLLDQNPERIAESVEISGSRAVPVTKIVTDDGKAYGVLGADLDAIDKVLGIPAAA